jgi:hypothetical protein
LEINTTGIENTALGRQALANNSTGNNNTAIGSGAGQNATNGSNNIYINNPGVAAESNAIRIGTQGTQTSTFIAGINGNNLVGSPVVVDSNGQLGTGAASSDVAGTTNTVIKFTSATSGGDSQIFDNGTSVGVGTVTPGTKLDVAGAVNASTQYKIGGSTVLSIAGTQNLFIGAVGAGQANTTGNQNTAVGAAVLQTNTTGIQNTATGALALRSNTTGSQNTATGTGALDVNTTGAGNTATGSTALSFNTTGFNNTASGASALQRNTTGARNTAVGTVAMANNTLGEANTAVGMNAMNRNTSGMQNTAIGYVALETNTEGNNNTAIGIGADVAVGDLTNATAIGAGAIVDASNKIRLGSAAVTVIEGQVPFSFTSDKTKKENFRLVDGEDVLNKLRELAVPSWNFIGQEPKKFRHYGPMAQDFFAAFGYDGVGTIGTPTTINSGDMAGILMIAVQALEKRTQELKAKEARIVALEELTKEKQARVDALERRTQETDAAIGALKVETAKLKAKDAQIETLVSRLEALTRTVLAAGQLPNGESANALLSLLRP